MIAPRRIVRLLLLSALALGAGGCLDTAVDFSVAAGEDTADFVSPDVADAAGGETAADLAGDTPDPLDTPAPTDTLDTLDDLVDVADPDLTDTVGPVDTVDTIDPADGGDDTPDPDVPCVPACDGKVCGDDGCGGDCGTCDDPLICEAGLCLPLEFSLSCEDRCGETGQNCDCDEGCFAAGSCCGDICVAFCTDLLGCTCGDDTCEGLEDCESCPTDCGCGVDALCLSGICCTPDCVGQECGGDGCGGTCGACTGDQQECVDGACLCQPACTGIDCGPDGCGGSCGACDDGIACTDDACVDGLCAATIGPFFCFIDDACVPSGAENLDNPCEKCKPAIDPEDWTPREDGVPCGATATCWQGACCDAVANCAGKDCGDDSCGWVCGACGAYEVCDDDGLCACDAGSALCDGTCCEPGQVCHGDACCFPACGGKNCGTDGCGGTCGACTGAQEVCDDGLCTCQPACTGQVCGPDGCGGACGTCAGAQEICDGGACICQPDCGGKNCGADGCGGSCGDCSVNETCTAEGFCECAAGGAVCGGGCCAAGELCHDDACCTPDCAGKDCGTDGCGGACGTCTGGQEICDGGLCSCQPACTGKECGADGCGGACGACAGAQESCVGGACICQPACAGMACGADGCGGTCGACDDDLSCTDDTCADGACVFTINPFHCLLDGFCVPSGTSNPLNPCEACSPATAQESWTVLEDGSLCGVGQVCFSGACCDVPGNCAGKECGDDGCGGACGTCTGAQELCVAGLCVCQPDCSGKTCGGDGCGGTCGECGANEVCAPGFSCVCVPSSVSCDGVCCAPNSQVCAAGTCCTPDCAGKDCGADGCGDVCGACGEDQVCIGDLCPPDGDQCDDFNSVDWDGCTGGQLTEVQANVELVAEQLDPDVAVNHLDQFLLVWESKDQDGDNYGVFGRLFGADGAPVGPELQLNTYTQGIQQDPSVAALADGRFVVAWTSDVQPPDGSSEGIFARLVGTDGQLDGDEIPVNAYVWGIQQRPSVAATDAGFVVAWDGQGSGEDNTKEIWCRPFDPDGVPTDGQTRINAGGEDAIEAEQRSVSIASLGGGAIAAWASKDQDGNGWGIFGRRLGADCTKLGSELQVNAAHSGNQDLPAVAVLDSGVFLGAFEGNIDGGVDGAGIGARRFSGTGTALGTDVLVNTTLGGDQEAPCVAAAGGGYVVAWQSNGQDGHSKGVYVQRLSTIGVHAGLETQANVHWDKEQQAPACAGFSDGSFVIAWEGADDQDGDKWGIFWRRFDATGQPLYK